MSLLLGAGGHLRLLAQLGPRQVTYAAAHEAEEPHE